jgi:hypothetical protein
VTADGSRRHHFPSGPFLAPSPKMGTRRSQFEQLPGWNLALPYIPVCRNNLARHGDLT